MINTVDKFFYPDLVIINNEEYGAQKITKEGKVLIPCEDIPAITHGMVIEQKIGSLLIPLMITDFDFNEKGSLSMGTESPGLLTLYITNQAAEKHKPKPESNTINIGSISSNSVQVGNNNTQIHNATIKEIVKHVAESQDTDAKSKLKSLLENPTVSSLIGAGSSALLAAL